MHSLTDIWNRVSVTDISRQNKGPLLVHVYIGNQGCKIVSTKCNVKNQISRYKKLLKEHDMSDEQIMGYLSLSRAMFFGKRGWGMFHDVCLILNCNTLSQ